MKIVELDSPAPAVTAASPAAGASHPAAGSGAMPAARPGKPTDVREILGSIPEARIDEQALPRSGATAGAPAAAGTAGLEIPDFEAIYKAAGISEPPHGYTAFKVLEILESDHFAGLDHKARAAALAGFLKMNPTGPVPIADVIQDAVRRDQALDKFEELLRGKLAARAQSVEQENARLQAEIDELVRRHQETMEANRKAVEAEQARLGQWQVRKRIEERRLYESVGPFVEENPVSAEGVPGSTVRTPAPASPPAGTPASEGATGSDR
ncbi:MAG TPA: hypothetical protein VEL74_21845 [Thermoanaerobaculia bacterium]|nr:hypothetical protein [Thermoanaerobaculia bacterium]